MAYTEFRKSYGDFEIVIPAVDFSGLNIETALAAAEVFNNYLRDPYFAWYVCFYLRDSLPYRIYGPIRECIQNMKAVVDQKGLEEMIKQEMKCEIPNFHPRTTPGRVLRNEWCRHMAAEIKREFGL